MRHKFVSSALLGRVARTALASLGDLAGHSRIFVSGELVPRGMVLGPPHQKVVAENLGILVFCDLEPGADFGHECRYLLFDPSTGKIQQNSPARFPPYTYRQPRRYFHVLFPDSNKAVLRRRIPPPLRIAVGQPVERSAVSDPGRKRALLFSGSTEARHLNNLEYCWRLLRAHQFACKDIEVYCFDGKVNAVDWDRKSRRSLRADYRMKIRGPGKKCAFLRALNEAGKKLEKDDLLFIYTTGHGDGDRVVGPYLNAMQDGKPGDDVISACDVGVALQERAPHRCLIVFMQQCSSGGFEPFIVTNGSGVPTSFAAAARSGALAHGNDEIEYFTWNWLAAMNLRYLDDAALEFDLPRPCGPTRTKEAFDYAADRRLVGDDHPQYAPRPSLPADNLEL